MQYRDKELVKELSRLKVNLMKESLEFLGIDFGDTYNVIEYKNYLVGNPLQLGSSDTGGFSVMGNLSAGETGISPQMFDKLAKLESGHSFGQTLKGNELTGKDLGDAKGHKTYAYGLLYHPVLKKHMDSIKPVWTQKELESLFVYTVKQKADSIKRTYSGINQNQLDVLVSIAFNRGSIPSSISNVIKKNPNDPNLKNMLASWGSNQWGKYPGLRTRRAEEAAWYFA